MVEAAKSATETKALLADKKASAPNKLLAGSIMALYSLVEALLEKALLPLAEHAKSPPLPDNAPPPTPAEPAEVRELRGALEKADKTSIFFGANLGEESIANRISACSFSICVIAITYLLFNRPHCTSNLT